MLEVDNPFIAFAMLEVLYRGEFRAVGATLVAQKQSYVDLCFE